MKQKAYFHKHFLLYNNKSQYTHEYESQIRVGYKRGKICVMRKTNKQMLLSYFKLI